MAELNVVEGTIDIENISLFLEGKWITKEELKVLIKEKLDAGEYNIQVYADSLKNLDAELENVQDVSLKMQKGTYDKLGQFAQSLGRSVESTMSLALSEYLSIKGMAPEAVPAVEAPAAPEESPAEDAPTPQPPQQEEPAPESHQEQEPQAPESPAEDFSTEPQEDQNQIFNAKDLGINMDDVKKDEEPEEEGDEKPAEEGGSEEVADDQPAADETPAPAEEQQPADAMPSPAEGGLDSPADEPAAPESPAEGASEEAPAGGDMPQDQPAGDVAPQDDGMPQQADSPAPGPQPGEEQQPPAGTDPQPAQPPAAPEGDMPRKVTRVACHKCKTPITITSDQRPITVTCPNCGARGQLTS